MRSSRDGSSSSLKTLSISARSSGGKCPHGFLSSATTLFGLGFSGRVAGGPLAIAPASPCCWPGLLSLPDHPHRLALALGLLHLSDHGVEPFDNLGLLLAGLLTRVGLAQTFFDVSHLFDQVTEWAFVLTFHRAFFDRVSDRAWASSSCRRSRREPRQVLSLCHPTA